MAGAAYLLWLAVATYLFWAGLLRTDDARLILTMYLFVVLTNVAIFAVIRSGLNRYFREPSLTYLQITVAILWAMVLMAFTQPSARGPVLLLFTSIFFFGVFRMRTRQFIELAVLAVVLYAGLVAWEARGLFRQDIQVAVAQALVLAAVLIWMSFMGGYVARLRAELRKAMRRIEVLAHTDDLTGTENRRSITDALQAAIAQAEDADGHVAVCLLDLDRFKRINDRYGHPAGDQVLREFVQRVDRLLRRRDRLERAEAEGAIGRFGGEEFLVVLRDSDSDGARLAAERIREAIASDVFRTSDGTVSVSVSIGVAGWQPGESEVDLLRRADRALYRAKEKGRNRVCVAREGDS